MAYVLYERFASLLLKGYSHTIPPKPSTNCKVLERSVHPPLNITFVKRSITVIQSCPCFFKPHTERNPSPAEPGKEVTYEK